MTRPEEKNNFVEVYQCGETLHAGMIRGYLESHGIEVFITDEHSTAYVPYKMSGIKINVRAKDLDAARELLKTVEFPLSKRQKKMTYSLFIIFVFGAVVWFIIVIPALLKDWGII